jgi:Fe-S cluster biogenesis protein NfuA
MLTLDSASQALDGLRGGFNADGADLVVESATESRVVVRLVVTDETCTDCIVSNGMLNYLVLNAIAEQWPGVTQVDVLDPREDN